MNKVCVIKPDIKDRFDEFLKSGRIMLIQAPCGFGKTAVIRRLCHMSRLLCLEVQDGSIDYKSFCARDDWDILFIDDLKADDETHEYSDLIKLIKSRPEKRFILAGRGMISNDFIPFRTSGLLFEIDENDLFFDIQSGAKLFSEYGIKLSESELNSVMKESLGYPLMLDKIAAKMASGSEYNQKLIYLVKREIYKYYDEMIFCGFSLPIRRFLIELATFDSFTTELATVVSGNTDAGEKIALFRRRSRMLIEKEDGSFEFWKYFRGFLRWEQSKYYTSEQMCSIYNRGGLYYELNKDYITALEYYSKSGDEKKVEELVIKLISLPPAMGYYTKLEKYFNELSDSEILKSPALMQGICMLSSLKAEYDESERWYLELENFMKSRTDVDASANEAKSRLVWLDISLPHRTVMELEKALPKAYKMLVDEKISLAPFSVTSSLPSVLNGGKDFSDWSLNDEKTFYDMSYMFETVFGTDSVALLECVVAESRFEKGESISDRILALVSRIGEIQSKGTPDIEFAVTGLVARCQMNIGKVDDARHTLNTVKNRFVEKKYDRFLPNIDAMLCRIALKQGDIDYADEWYRNQAPRNSLETQFTKRYLYFTEAMTELALGNENAALVTLSPLEPYCIDCRRHIDMVHIKVLAAIAKYRKGDEGWIREFKEGLNIALRYGFLRTVSEYGVAVLPLLNDTLKLNDDLGENKEMIKFINDAIKAARGQAVYYPDFMRLRNGIYADLTESEVQVLRLLCADKSNSEIGEILDIRLTTVKSHVSHILQKLGVNRRQEAKTTAEKLHIF